MRIEIHYEYRARSGDPEFVTLTEEDLEQAAYEKATLLRAGCRIAGDKIEFVRMEVGN